MRLRWAIATLLALWLATPASGLAEETRPVSGLIESVNPNTRMVELGPMTFYVPGGVHDLDELDEGVKATVTYLRDGAGRLVATSIETSDLGE